MLSQFAREKSAQSSKSMVRAEILGKLIYFSSQRIHGGTLGAIRFRDGEVNVQHVG